MKRLLLLCLTLFLLVANVFGYDYYTITNVSTVATQIGPYRIQPNVSVNVGATDYASLLTTFTAYVNRSILTVAGPYSASGDEPILYTSSHTGLVDGADLGTVAWLDHPLGVLYGGTGATSASAARTALGVGTTDTPSFLGALLSAGGYINFGSTSGSSGYGIRDNSGTIQYKASGGSWANIGAGGATPGGNDTQVQFNDGGSSLGGDAGLIFDKTNDDLTVGRNVTLKNIITSIPTTDESYTGCTVIPLVANENQAFGDLCYINTDGEAQIGDGDAEANSRIVVVCVSSSVSADATGNYALIDCGGILYKTAWNWSAKGVLLRLSTSGTTGNTWTESILTGTDDTNVINGISLSADAIILTRITLLEHQ